jgi:hypothetical protein
MRYIKRPYIKPLLVNGKCQLLIKVRSKYIMVPHDKINLQTLVQSTPVGEVINLTIMTAMKQVTGYNEPLSLVMSYYMGQPLRIMPLRTARHRNAVLTEVGTLAPVNV